MSRSWQSLRLNYLNANGYVHRDIKPENIMYKATYVVDARGHLLLPVLARH